MTNERVMPAYDPLPEDIASWLISHDWQRASLRPQRPTLWVLGDRELLQPTIREAKDYQLRLSQMFRSLALWADRSVEALTEEMIHEGSDVSEWRANGLHDQDYSVPLEDGLTLVQSVRNAFVAAANASIQRRGYFGHSTLKAARDHARAVRMGQTRRGSYIVPIISRIPGVAAQAEEQQGRLDVEVSTQPFERRVMAQLADALQAMHELAVQADHEPSPRELNQRIRDGVSHELCTAVDSMLSTRSFGDVDVTFSWARRASRHPDIQRVDFPKEAAPIIANMAEKLRGSDVIAEQVLSGYVWITKHTAGEREGSIKVHAQIGNKPRTISVPLSRDQVHEAQVAAAEERPVFIRGQLVREQGRAWHFQSVSEFGVAEAVPLAWGAGSPDVAE